MTRLKTAILALFGTALIVIGVANRDVIQWQNPDEIIAQENQVMEQELDTYSGFPAGHEGVWISEDVEGHQHTIIMRGTQLIVTHPQGGTLYYEGIETQGNPDVEPNPEEPVTLLWDTDLFVNRYGAELLGPGPQPFMYRYDEATDQLQFSGQIVFKRDQTAERVWTIKNQLASTQPINLEQLRQVEDEFLLTRWQETQVKQLNDATALVYLYQSIATEHTELALLMAEDYEVYNELAHIISTHSDYSFSDLNTALPVDILRHYQATSTELATEDPATIVAAILPDITAAREAYFARRTEYENSLAQANQIDSPSIE